MTTTADSATITAQDRSQGRLEPVHAMNETTNPEGHKRSLPGRPPGIRADSSGLTDRQRRVIEVIRDSVQRRGYPPSMREIGQAVGLSSTSSVAHQLMALERKVSCAATRTGPAPTRCAGPTSPRRSSPRTPCGKPAASYVPLVGRIAAGGPILAEESVEDVFPLPGSSSATVSCSS